ncbi:MAG TPA: sulfotransferase domain-containing protein [Stellaceae bacterium]|nr:sulfotransferase domain-containing protein [Stellaceae bacterium]
MNADSQSTNVTTASLAAPDLLIHFHIPKTGGTTLNIILRGNFPQSQVFVAQTGEVHSALWSESLGALETKYNSLPAEERRMIRCVAAGHLPMGVHEIFGRRAKYVTVLRNPVDRVLSHYYFARKTGISLKERVFDSMTLDQYLDSKIDLGPHNFQVRLLSGARELDSDMDKVGSPLEIAPVEERHLEMAKRNIEKYFLAAAPLEDFAALVLYLRRIYGWRWTGMLYDEINPTKDRLTVGEIPAATQRRIEALNRFDAALYDWAKTRFRLQIDALGASFARELSMFRAINSAIRIAGGAIPFGMRKRLALWLLYRRNSLREV